MKAIAWFGELLERLVVVALIIESAPLMFLLSVVIILSSTGSAFVQERWSSADRGQISVFNFRTRTRTGRRTTVGQFLEKYSINKMPMLFNVERGEIRLKEFLEHLNWHWW